MAREQTLSGCRHSSGIIRWGGLSLLAAAVCLVLFVVLVFTMKQELPVPAPELLERPAVPTTLFLVAALGELLLMPGGLALYFALRRVRPTVALLATGPWLLSVVLFLVSRGQIIGASRMSPRYLDATAEAARAAYLASAELAIEVQNVYASTAVVLLCIASIVFGLVMLGSDLGRRMGYVVVAAGTLFIFSPFAVMLGIPLVISFVGMALTAFWQAAVGIRLYRMGIRG